MPCLAMTGLILDTGDELCIPFFEIFYYDCFHFSNEGTSQVKIKKNAETSQAA
jgi:hypothetical protein